MVGPAGRHPGRRVRAGRHGPCTGARRSAVLPARAGRGVNKARVETFSDGVFAIAITLLVLTIAQPEAGHFDQLAPPAARALALPGRLRGQLPGHRHHVGQPPHRLLPPRSGIDRGLFYWNLLLLMTIVFIPYPTEVFGEALRLHQGARTAAVFYSITMTVNALMWAGMWLHASRGRRLLSPDFPESQRTVSTLPLHRRHADLRGLHRGGLPQRLALPDLPRRAGPLLRLRSHLPPAGAHRRRVSRPARRRRGRSGRRWRATLGP